MKLSDQKPKITNEIVRNEGFKVLTVKYHEDSSIIRQLFLKQFILNFHKNVDDSEKPENRTLFVINVPPFINEHHINYLFEKCGKTSRIYFQLNPSLSTASTLFNKIQRLDATNQDKKMGIESVTDFFKHENGIVSYKVCYVVFNKPIGLSNALKMTQTDKVYCFQPNLSQIQHQQDIVNNAKWFTGIRLWQKQYNDSIVAPHVLKKVAESFIEQHKDPQEDEVQDSGQPNDDQGWVTVNRKLRRDRGALVNDCYHDQKIQETYKIRELKRKNEKTEFDELIEPIIKGAMKKKKIKKMADF